MRRLVIALVVLVPLCLVGWYAVDTAAHRWSWRQADLDRNSLTLGHYRGAESGERLADWVEYGDVVEASGESPRTRGGDAEVVVSYQREVGGWLAGVTTTTETDCYRFRFDDGYQTTFRRVGCPD